MRSATLVAFASVGGLLALPAPADEDAAQFALGKKLFVEVAIPPCATCHVLKNSGSEGAIGPDLDELKPDATRVTNAVRDGLGTMPPYQASLSDEEIAALARYVSEAGGGAK